MHKAYANVNLERLFNIQPGEPLRVIVRDDLIHNGLLLVILRKLSNSQSKSVSYKIDCSYASLVISIHLCRVVRT